VTPLQRFATMFSGWGLKGLGGTRVLDAARTLAKQSHIPSRRLLLVDRHTTYAHNDPNSASPGRNVFLKRLLPFLARVAKG
jgi:hypothetical protein